MGALLQFSFEFVSEVCCYTDCGISFAMPRTFYNQLQNEKKNGWSPPFYCPRGHRQFYSGDTPAEKVRKEMQAKLDEQIRFKQMANDRADRNAKWAEQEKRKKAALRGVLTKTRNRIVHGVCPCCNRTFQNLQKHMATQHPQYKKRAKDAHKMMSVASKAEKPKRGKKK